VVSVWAGGTSLKGQRLELVEQAGLIALDGEQVVGPALEHQVVGVAPLCVQRVRRDHRVLQIVDALAQHREHWDFIGLALDVDLTKHHGAAVINRGQQVPGLGGVTG
jgi:hypothetical protein